jgi:macrodomain Ter protein organizer (MatP/YcbG family)
MAYITKLKNLFSLKNQPVLLGRWNVVYCEKKINKKLDLSNEDHCGSCNQYNNKEEEQQRKKKKIKLEHLIFYENI